MDEKIGDGRRLISGRDGDDAFPAPWSPPPPMEDDHHIPHLLKLSDDGTLPPPISSGGCQDAVLRNAPRLRYPRCQFETLSVCKH